MWTTAAPSPAILTRPCCFRWRRITTEPPAGPGKPRFSSGRRLSAIAPLSMSIRRRKLSPSRSTSMAGSTGAAWKRLQAGRLPPCSRNWGRLFTRTRKAGRWETADAYLSGNVRHKLAAARAAAAIDKKYHRNIAPLEGAQPADLTPGEISARLGSTWIPTDDLGDFVADVIEASHTAVRVDYVPEVATWAVTAKPYAKSNVANTTNYGTERFTAIDLIEDALNGKVPTAYDTIPGPDGDKRVINEARTLEAREAQQKLKDKFAEWIWQ